MAANPNIVVDYLANTKGLDKGLKGVKKNSASVGKAFKVVGAAAAVGFGLVAVGAKKSIDAASDLNESVNAVNVTFGKASKTVLDFAQNAATKAGLSMREFNEAVVPIGASLQNLGFSQTEAAKTSVDLAQRAADMASVFNTSVPDALQAIQAGLRGEADPLERFGVGLSDSAVKAQAMAMHLAKTTAALTDQDKAQARVALLMKQTNRLAGDFENTSDGYANAQRIIGAEFENISAKIGGFLLPAVAKAASGFADFLGAFGKAQGAQAKFRVVMDGLRSIAVSTWQAISDAIRKIDWGAVAATVGSAVRTIWEKLRSVVRTTDWAQVGRDISDLLTKSMGLVDKAIAGRNWTQTGREMGAGMATAINAFQRFLDGIKWGPVLKGAFTSLMNLWRAQIELIGGIAQELGRAAVAGVARGLSGLAQAVVSVVSRIPGWIKSAAGAVAGAAFSIGADMVRGMINGVASMAGSLASKAAEVVTGAKDAAMRALHIKSPSLVWAALGVDTINGYILGITQTEPKLKGKTAEAVLAALNAARAVVERQQESFRNTFGKLGDYAARAFAGRTDKILADISARFDASIAKWNDYADALTPAEKQLAEIQESEEKRARAAEVTAAKAALAASETAEERADATERLRQANLANQVAALEKEAAQQRAARQVEAAEHIRALEATKARELQNQQELREQQAAALDAQLTQLQERLAKHPEEYRKVQQQITKLLASYGVNYSQAGEDLGEAFANGLRRSQNAVEKAAKALAQTVARYLPHSPAETGPLSRPFFTGFGRTLADNMLSGVGRIESAAQRLARAAAISPSLTGSSLEIAGAAAPPSVRVFIGDQELRGLVRAEVVDVNTGIARTLLAGGA